MSIDTAHKPSAAKNLTLDAKSTGGRIFYIDVIRAFAGFFVVTSHVFAPVCAGMNDFPLPVWWLFNLLDSVIRLSVPLYVMISGKIFLGTSRETPYLQFVWNRYSRLVPAFFVWSMIYAYDESRIEGTPYTVSGALHQFISGPTEYHLWFMYMILGIYLVAPFLRRFVQVAKPADLAALLGLWWGFLAVQFLIPGSTGFGPATMLLDYGGYFILGYVLDKTRVSKDRIRWLIAGSVAIIVFNAGATYLWVKNHGGILDDKFFVGVSPLVALYAASFFLIIKHVDYPALLNRFPKLQELVHGLSENSYNVYLNHAFFIWLFTKGQLGFTLSEETGDSALIGIPLTSIAVLACSLGASLGLQKVPVLRRLLVVSPGNRTRP